MKSTYKLMFFTLVLIFASCEKLADLNVDPDKSPTARPQEVLTSAQGYAAWVVDDRLNLLAYQWAQYLTWGPGVSIGNAPRYIAEPDDHNNLWGRTYSNALADIKFLIASDDVAFSAVGKVLHAYLFQMLVDHFGDVPYSEALLGEIDDGSVLAPKYDDAAGIYADLIVKLDAAIAELATTEGNEITGEDLVYGGDLAHWATFAKSLKLRILMRQSDVVDVTREVQDLVAEGDLIQTKAEMAEMDFAGTSGDENPMFAGQEAGITFFYVASNTTLDYLASLNDPRVDALYQIAPNTGVLTGEYQGTAFLGPLFGKVREDYSLPSVAAYNNAASVIFMSDWEIFFLRAEAAAKYGTADDEAAMFAAGVQASFDQLGVGDASIYISSLGYNPADDIKERMRLIATQKWIACNGFQEDEGWTEARRLDTPDNPIFTDVNTGVWKTPERTSLSAGVHPTIFLYPQSEQSLNSSAPTQRTLLDKVFWDK